MDYYVTNYNIPVPGAVALQDCIMRKGSPVTAGSKILEKREFVMGAPFFQKQLSLYGF